MIVDIGVIGWASLVGAVTTVVARLARPCRGWVAVPPKSKGDEMEQLGERARGKITGDKIDHTSPCGANAR